MEHITQMLVRTPLARVLEFPQEQDHWPSEPGPGDPPAFCSSVFSFLFPSILGSGILQLLQSRTSRKFLACRLTPDMETKLLFMTSRVSWPTSAGREAAGAALLPSACRRLVEGRSSCAIGRRAKDWGYSVEKDITVPVLTKLSVCLKQSLNQYLYTNNVIYHCEMCYKRVEWECSFCETHGSSGWAMTSQEESYGLLVSKRGWIMTALLEERVKIHFPGRYSPRESDYGICIFNRLSGQQLLCS